MVGSEGVNNPHSIANTFIPAEFAGLFTMERFIGNLLMSTLLMFLASPQNTAVSAEFCWLSSRGMFTGNGAFNRTP
jgi:hypothetical protein